MIRERLFLGLSQAQGTKTTLKVGYQNRTGDELNLYQKCKLEGMRTPLNSLCCRVRNSLSSRPRGDTPLHHRLDGLKGPRCLAGRNALQPGHCTRLATSLNLSASRLLIPVLNCLSSPRNGTLIIQHWGNISVLFATKQS